MKNSFKCKFGALLFLMTLAMAQPAFSFIDGVGEPITITGTVYECDATGSGIQIDTGEEIVSVFGKGPVWYWEQLGVDFPEVGETVTISVFEITFSDGTVKLVAKSFDLENDGTADIDLREDDGTPLWRQHGKNIFQNQAQTQARKGARWAE